MPWEWHGRPCAHNYLRPFAGRCPTPPPRQAPAEAAGAPRGDGRPARGASASPASSLRGTPQSGPRVARPARPSRRERRDNRSGGEDSGGCGGCSGQPSPRGAPMEAAPAEERGGGRRGAGGGLRAARRGRGRRGRRPPPCSSLVVSLTRAGLTARLAVMFPVASTACRQG
jgi:hypothetical protein